MNRFWDRTPDVASWFIVSGSSKARAHLPRPPVHDVDDSFRTEPPTTCSASRDPLGPGGDSEIGSRPLVQHRQVFELVTVWIAKVDRRGRHPADDARLAGRLAEEGERSNALSAKQRRRFEQLVEADPERNVQDHAQRSRPE